MAYQISNKALTPEDQAIFENAFHGEDKRRRVAFQMALFSYEQIYRNPIDVARHQGLYYHSLTIVQMVKNRINARSQMPTHRDLVF